jgi:glycosyltransferase involved in cell wall biosynthesis
VLIPVYNERHVVEASLRRLLALEHAFINKLEVIVVDDCSMGGTSETLHRLASEDSRITLIRHDQNKGKGAAVRTGIALATGDITIIHDADLEYNPEDISGTAGALCEGRRGCGLRVTLPAKLLPPSIDASPYNDEPFANVYL